MSKVSVILPTYARNGSGLLELSIESVLSQTFSDFELLIVDDGSTDGTQKTIREYVKRDLRVHHIRFERNVGLPALTSAIAFGRSKGEYIAWQFDDCQWMPQHLETLVLQLDQSCAGVAYGKARILDTADVQTVLGSKFSRSRLIAENFIPNCSALIRREVFDTCGWLDPHILMKRICDYDMWLRASKEYDFIFVDEIIALESGPSQHDSLGNSVYLDKCLTSRYLTLERNEHLKITNISAWDPSWKPPFIDDALGNDFLYIIVEHAIKTGQLELALKKTRELKDHSMDLKDIWKWYANETNRRQALVRNEFIHYVNRLENEVKLKRDYIAKLEFEAEEKAKYVTQLESRGKTYKSAVRTGLFARAAHAINRIRQMYI